MHGDNGVLVDFVAISRLIASADIFVLAFPHTPECLLVDARANEKEGGDRESSEGEAQAGTDSARREVDLNLNDETQDEEELCIEDIEEIDRDRNGEPLLARTFRRSTCRRFARISRGRKCAARSGHLQHK
jgi:hypothetical protein